MTDATTLQFEIVTPERKVLTEAILQVTVPTVQGEITILPHHIPLVALLRPGALVIQRADGSQELLAVSGGFIEVLPSKVVVLADTAELSTEIDETRAHQAHQRAVVLMQQQRRADSEEYATLVAKMEKELARLKVAQKKKYRDLPQARQP